MADRGIARRIDPESLDCYLALGYIPGNRCILKGFRKLPAAHALMFKPATAECRIWRYWQLPALTGAECGNWEADLLDELDALLEDAVRRQLVADVPVGVLLSGGLDSSLIAAMAARGGNSVRTFTIRFPGFAEYDESEHARLVARQFGTDHVELDAASATVDCCRSLLDRSTNRWRIHPFSQPSSSVGSLGNIARSPSVVRAAMNCSAVIFITEGNSACGAGLNGSRRTAAVRGESGWEVLPAGLKGRNWLQQAGFDSASGCRLPAVILTGPFAANSWPATIEWPLAAEAIRTQSIPAEDDLLQRSTRYDFDGLFSGGHSCKVDRASMLSSLEVRAPMLDYRLIEFAFGRIPSNLKATVKDRKILLKRLAARVLPPEFNRHRKQGFSIPLASWLRTPAWGQFFRDVLLDSRSGLICKKTVIKLLQGQVKGRSNSERLFALMMLELWQREYAASLWRDRSLGALERRRYVWNPGSL